MSEAMDQRSLLQELLMKVALLEENVAFLEMWCEEQQDALDVVGPASWPSEDGVPIPRGTTVDLRDGDRVGPAARLGTASGTPGGRRAP